MLPFVSTNGLAGDVIVIKGIISQRQIEISSLRERIIELGKMREEEAEALEEDITRRIRAPKRRLKATTQERSRMLKELEIAHLARTGPIIERIDELQQLNDHDRSLIAPIRKLPAELLSYVFHHHVDLDNSPWVLTLVSRSWSHTAMTNPSLWVHLLLYGQEYLRFRDPNEFELWHIDGHSWYSKGRRVVCHDSSELNTIVSRAGSLPLDVDISYRNDNAPVVQSILGDTAIARRVASLVINGARPYEQLSSHHLAGVTVGSFPLLHTLTISSVPVKKRDEILESISSSSPHLKHLTTYQTIPLSLNFSFWPKLRSLNLDHGSDNKLFNNLIPHLRGLEILKGCPLGWPNNSTPEITLAKLTTLEVFCLPEYLRKLRLPALIYLSIGEGHIRTQMETDGGPLISLPSLETLDLNTRGFLSWLAILSAPRLRVFILRQTGVGPSEDASVFQNIRFPTVQEFTLDTPWTHELVISALECVPNAEKVVMTSTYTFNGDQWALEILQRLADAENMLCPNMTHFTLGSPSNKVGLNLTSAKAHVQRGLKNRMDGGVKMDHFEIHFTWRGKSVQYA
jgi:polyhydroxyalkanoate synthesis regulator phasin